MAKRSTKITTHPLQPITAQEYRRCLEVLERMKRYYAEDSEVREAIKEICDFVWAHGNLWAGGTSRRETESIKARYHAKRAKKLLA